MEIDNMYLVRRYFNQENVVVKELGNRLIVTIKEPENATAAAALKKELEQLNPSKKVSVIFVQDHKEGEIKNVVSESQQHR